MILRVIALKAFFFCVSFIAAFEGNAQDIDTYHVGVARVDITPGYPIRLNGFGGRREEATEVRQRIWAKALAIANPGSKPVVLLAIDSLGVRMDMVDQVAKRLEQSHAIPRQNIALTFSHSHCTPKVNGASDNIFSTPIPPDHQTHIDRYTRELTDHLYEAANSALTDMRACRLEWSVGNVDFAINRRTPGGPVDHDLPVLVARDEQDSIRAIYVSYACHCVALTENKISGDWAGYAQEFIERQFPDAIAMVSIGAGSDSNPNLRQSDETASSAISLGTDIATETSRLLNGPMVPITGRISAELKTISLPLNTLPSKQELQALAEKGGSAGYNAQTQLDRLARGVPLLDAVAYPVQNWRFGDQFAIVFLAGEVCVDYSLRLKQELNRDRIWINAYSNDFGCYIPSERLLREGGYGGGSEIPYFALPTTLKSGLEDQIVSEVTRQLPQTFRTPPGTQGIPPKSPQESLRAIKTHPQLSVQLVASEPLITDPVAIDFDPGGGLWVVEMPDYGNPVTTDVDPSGRIKYLTDENRDGVFDRATIFASGFLFPMDVKCWRDGVLVCDAPDIIFLRDDDGDGQADMREILYTGFETHNPHGRVNSLRWGLDNWLYGSCGLFGGDITNQQGEKLVLGARDFRVRPDDGLIQPATGKTQQGRARDDWGRWFGCDNSTLIFQYPLSEDYLSRNPQARPPATNVRIVPNQKLFPPEKIVAFQLTGPPGTPTSACGLTIYRDDLLGEAYRGNALVAEPVNQMVHRRVLEPRGATFTAVRAVDETQSEFLISDDRWFRPVQVRTGPDGAIWIVDMYRFVIEHPRWIPDEVEPDLNIFAGQEQGRIYRVVPKNRPLREVPNYRAMSGTQLVAALDQANGTQRDLAHQLLIWRDERSVADELRQLVRSSTNPVAKVHALSILQHWSECSLEILKWALKDPTAEVRCHAIKLSESLLASEAELLIKVMELAGDPDFEVAMQSIYSLGSIGDERCAGTIADAASTSTDPYMSFAILTAINKDNVRAIVDAVLRWDPAVISSIREELLWQAFELADDGSVDQIVRSCLERPHQQRQLWQLRLLAKGLAKYPRQVLDCSWLQTEAGRQSMATLANDSRTVALDANLSSEIRTANIRLLVHVENDRARIEQNFAELMVPDQDIDIQTAAIELITEKQFPSAVTLMIKQLPSATPELGRQLIATIIQRDTWISQFLNACLENRQLSKRITTEQRQRLLSHRNLEIKKLAHEVFQTATDEQRQTLIANYQEASMGDGNVARGKAVFTEHCVKCHLETASRQVIGPDLAGITNRNRQWLLETILDPNRDIDARYLNYVLQLKDGRTVMGIVSGETSTSLELHQQDGTSQTILRADIEEMRNSGVSFMPEGFERDIDVSDMGHLLGYLMSFNQPPKSFPGNEPRILTPDQVGEIVLPASAAKIYGNQIVFESKYQNIGYWHDHADHATWDIETQYPAVYKVTLDYACPDANAGNRFRMDGSKPSLFGVVRSTGSWDRYRRFELGNVEIPEGRSLITVSPDGPPSGALFDLKTIHLVPVSDQN